MGSNPTRCATSEQTALHYANRHSRKAVPVGIRSAPFAPPHSEIARGGFGFVFLGFNVRACGKKRRPSVLLRSDRGPLRRTCGCAPPGGRIESTVTDKRCRNSDFIIVSYKFAFSLLYFKYNWVILRSAAGKGAVKPMIKRELYMSRIRPFIGSDLIKVMTGIRRCGKSVMLSL